MIRSLTILGAFALAATSTVFAQQQPQQPPARGVEMGLALEAAQAAVSTCLSQGVKGAAAVLDSAGVLRILVSADGASTNASVLSPKKGIAAIQMGKSSAEIQAEAEKDAALKAKLEADKNIFPRAGALLIKAGNDVVGAIAFGGANAQQGGGTHDEACAKAGLDKIQARVK
jgi:uncharacterized protein GlcG (DUF336 family)